ncbi:MAG: TIGR02270 family protein, partial [Thermoguttaceae bacterium]
VVALGTSSYELSRALVSALGWLPFDEAAVYIRRFLATNSTALRRIGIAAAAVHRHDPGQPLVNAVDAADGSLRARAIRAVGELGRADLLPVLKSSFDAGDDQVRFAAAWSIARLADDAGATEILRTIVENGTTGHERALPLALGKMEVSQAVKWIRHLNENPRLVRTAIRGAGLLGLPDLVPWLIDIIPVAQLARLAGEAFCMITGIQLALDGLEGRRPAGFESGPTDDPKDHNVAMDADENLFWPDQNKVAAWWRANSHRFEPGTRYFVGKPMTIDWLNHVLRHGYQRQRAAAALELAIRQPGTPLFEVRAPGFRQQELLR